VNPQKQILAHSNGRDETPLGENQITMSELPKQRKGCLLKIVLSLAILFGVSFIHALTAEPRAYGGSPAMNPILSMIACGAIIALWFWKPGNASEGKDTAIKPLDKDDDDSDTPYS
jgi:hypothetical protein